MSTYDNQHHVLFQKLSLDEKNVIFVYKHATMVLCKKQAKCPDHCHSNTFQYEHFHPPLSSPIFFILQSKHLSIFDKQHHVLFCKRYLQMKECHICLNMRRRCVVKKAKCQDHYHPSANVLLLCCVLAYVVCHKYLFRVIN